MCEEVRIDHEVERTRREARGQLGIVRRADDDRRPAPGGTFRPRRRTFEDRGRQPALLEERGEVAPMARDGEDSRRRGRQAQCDEVVDKAAGVGGHRGRGQRRGRVGLVGLRGALVGELGETASFARSQAEGQTCRRRIVLKREAAPGGLGAKVEDGSDARTARSTAHRGRAGYILHCGALIDARRPSRMGWLDRRGSGARCRTGRAVSWRSWRRSRARSSPSCQPTPREG